MIEKRIDITRQAFLRTFAAASLFGGTGVAAAGRAMAQGAFALPGTRLILLGTAGGPAIQRFRSEPSNLLVVDGTPYIIDVGYGCLRQLARAGYKSSDLAGVFITHHHLDHDADLVDIISYDWIQGRKAKLPIYGPYGTQHMVSAALDYFSTSERIFGQEESARGPASQFVDPHDILAAGPVYSDDKIKVIAAENSHFHTFNPGQDKSFAYRVETATRTVVFTGDTGPSDAVVALAKDADVLVSEVIDAEAVIRMASSHTSPADAQKLADHMNFEHLSPEEVGKMAAKANVKMVVLTHIAPSDGSVPDAARFTAGVKRIYNGPVIAGQDLLEI